MLRRLLVAISLGLSAMGAAQAADNLTKLGEEAALGKNLTGEECRLRFVAEEPNQAEYRRFALYCQGWHQPSGEIRRFRSMRNFDAVRALTDSPYVKVMETRLTQCEPARTTQLADGTVAALRACRARNGGWPTVVFAASVEGYSYYGESLPTNQPVLESGALILAGKQKPVAQASRTALVQALEAAVGTSATQFGVQDIGAISDLKALGLQYQYRRDLEAAEATYRRALEIVERVFGANAWAAGDLWSQIALAQITMERTSDGAQSLARAEPLVRRSPDPRDLRRYLSYHSSLLREQGDAAGAVKRAQEATAYARENKLPAATLGNALMFEAEALVAARRYGDGATLAEQAISELSRGYGAWHPEIGITWDWIGIARLENNEPAKAREAHARSLEQRQVLYGGGVPVAEAYFGLGRAYRAERNMTASLDAFRQGVQALTRDRFGRSGLRATRVAGYLQAVNDAAQGSPANAAAFWGEAIKGMQMVRGDVTSGAIRQMAARLATDDPAIGQVTRQLQDQQDRIGRLRADLAREGRRQSEERDPAFEEQVKAEIRAAGEQAEALERQVQGQYPRYAGLVARNLVGAEELTPLLKPDEALVTMLVAPAVTYVVALRGSVATGHRVAISAADLTELVARVRAGVDWPDGTERKFDLAASRELHRLLIAPLEPHLRGVLRLVVVPGGPLQSLPFALLAAGGDGQDYGKQDWLARRFAIATAPSLVAFRDLRQAKVRAAAPQPFIGFGDPDFAGTRGGTRGVQTLANACRRGLAPTAELRDLPRLPESADELARIAQTLKAPATNVVLGAKATETAVKAAKLSDYRVVMFATHGILPSEIKCLGEPALALTPPKGASARDDGLLNASEVVALSLNADFVVLSACNTASADGKLSGEALSGLTRAFFYAGARAALVSHWAVASEPTVALTTGTFAAYAREPAQGRAQALRAAQIAMMDKPATAHPIFWAPFVLVGDGS